MDEAWFHSLPALCRNRKYAFAEMHALACPSPRPVVVKVGVGHKKLPSDLWPAAEFLTAVLQGQEVFECDACNIEAFLAQLLSKVVLAADVLGNRACLGHKGLLSLCVMRAKPSVTLAKPRNGTAPLMGAKSLLDTQETHIFLETELAPATQNMEGEPATLQVTLQDSTKLEADRCVDASAPQGEQMGLETFSNGRARVALFEKQNDAAEGQDDCPMRHEPQCDSAATVESEEEPSEEVKIEDSAQLVQQETAKQRRRKKRRERLRQKARA